MNGQRPVRWQARQVFFQMRQGQIPAADDVAVGMLRRGSHIDDQQRLTALGPLAGQPLGQGRPGDPFGDFQQIFAADQGVHAAGKKTGHVVEADPTEPHDGLLRITLVFRDDDDRPVAAEHRAGPGGVLPGEGDVERAAKVAPFKVDCVADVEQLAAVFRQGQHFVEREGLEVLLHRGLERTPLLPVEDCIVHEVVGGLRLVGGDQRFELLPAHRLEGIVELLLLAHR